MAPDVPAAADPLLGTRLGGFGLVERLGRGGMGWVYRAHDAGLDRWVAVKVLPPDFAHAPKAVARFLREARTLARLRHPQLAAIHAVGEENGWHYFAMELVAGQSLAECLAARGPLPWTEALDIVGQILAALAAAHAVGIVHRDVKPANVMIEPSGRVVLVDFGLARPEDSDTPEPSENFLTERGVWVGTPDYMAPEQVDGHATPQSDLYALGALWFEMLAGVPPHRRSSWVLTIREKLEGPPPTWHGAAGDLPAAFLPLGRQLLSPRPEERPVSAVALLRTLADLFPSPVLRTLAPEDERPRDPSATAPTLVEVRGASVPDAGDSTLFAPPPSAAPLPPAPPAPGTARPAPTPLSETVAPTAVDAPPLATRARRLRRRRAFWARLSATATGLALGLTAGLFFGQLPPFRPTDSGFGRDGRRPRLEELESWTREWTPARNERPAIQGVPSNLVRALNLDRNYHEFMLRTPDRENDDAFFAETLAAARRLAEHWRAEGVLADRLPALSPREMSVRRGPDGFPGRAPRDGRAGRDFRGGGGGEGRSPRAPGATASPGRFGRESGGGVPMNPRLLLDPDEYPFVLLAQEASLAFFGPPPLSAGEDARARPGRNARGRLSISAFWDAYWREYAEQASRTPSWNADELERVRIRVRMLRQRLRELFALPDENGDGAETGAAAAPAPGMDGGFRRLPSPGAASDASTPFRNGRRIRSPHNYLNRADHLFAAAFFYRLF